MLDLLEAPPSQVPTQLQPFTFDSAKASAAARRRHELDRLRKEAPQLSTAQTAQLDPALRNANAKEAALTRVLGQLEAIDLLMDKAADAKTWDMLSRAKERLAKVWFHLGGIAAVAPIKSSSREPRGQTLATWQPVPATVAPMLHVQAQPEPNPSGHAPNAVTPTVSQTIAEPKQ